MSVEKFEAPESETGEPKMPDNGIKNVYSAEEKQAIFERCIGDDKVVELPEGSKRIASDNSNAGDLYGSSEDLYLAPDGTLYTTHTPSNGRYGGLRAKKWYGTWEDWRIVRHAEAGKYFNINSLSRPKDLPK